MAATYTAYFNNTPEVQSSNNFPTYEVSNGNLDSVFPTLMIHSGIYSISESKKRKKIDKETSPYSSDDESHNNTDLLNKLSKCYEKPIRTTKEDRELPLTILLNSGRYDLPSGFSCDLTANFSSRTPTGFPDVIIKGSGIAGGDRSWSGIIFDGTKYESSAGKQKFFNCIFRNDAYIKLGDYGEFINCQFLQNDSTRTPVEIARNAKFEGCTFNGVGVNTTAYISIKSSCTDATTINNCKFNFSIRTDATADRRRFSPINISGSNPLLFSSSVFDFESDNAETILFSSCSNTALVTLTISNTIATNRTNNALFCAVLSNLWSNGGLIEINNSTFSGMRMLLYGATRCSHLTKCLLKEDCSHMRPVSSDWNQSLVITNTTIRTETQGDILAASFDLSDVELTSWSISFLNSVLYVNRQNIPFNINNARSISLNIIGSTFIASNIDPLNQQPWLNIIDVGVLNILTSPATTFVNLASATRSSANRPPGTVTITNAGGLPLSS